jgi:hypothetical protein
MVESLVFSVVAAIMALTASVIGIIRARAEARRSEVENRLSIRIEKADGSIVMIDGRGLSSGEVQDILSRLAEASSSDSPPAKGSGSSDGEVGPEKE